MVSHVLACAFCSGGDMHQGANLLWFFLLALAMTGGLIWLGRKSRGR